LIVARAKNDGVAFAGDQARGASERSHAEGARVALGDAPLGVVVGAVERVIERRSARWGVTHTFEHSRAAIGGRATRATPGVHSRSRFPRDVPKRADGRGQLYPKKAHQPTSRST
jgi:hypothetical protein